MSQTMDRNDEFSQNGFLHLKSFVSALECQRLILRMHELVHSKAHKSDASIFKAGNEDHISDDHFLASANKISFFFDKNAPASVRKDGTPFKFLNKVGHALHRLCPVFAKFSYQNKFLELVTELGQEKPKLIQSMFIFKQSKFGDEVPPHQDASFIYTEPNYVIGLWLALEDASKENGCLWVLREGHRGGLKNRFVKTNNGLNFRSNRRVFWPKEAFEPLPAQAGDVIVLHGLLPHFSEKNVSPNTRFAYTIHFVDQKSYYPNSNWLKLNY